MMKTIPGLYPKLGGEEKTYINSSKNFLQL